jgi:hypothetical protein
MITVNYTDKASLQSFAERLEGMLDSQKVRVTTNMVVAGILHGGWLDHVLRFFVGRKFFGMAMSKVLQDNRHIALEIWNAGIHHLQNGHDRFDPKSAGGFSKEELVQIAGYVKSVGFEAIEIVG